VRASAERGRVQGPGRAEAEFGPWPGLPYPALPSRARHPIRQSRASWSCAEVDVTSSRLRRLRIAFGPIEVVEVVSHDQIT
jgi:hypothetical protein